MPYDADKKRDNHDRQENPNSNIRVEQKFGHLLSV